VIVQLLLEDVHEYRWQRVFDQYAQLRPDLSVDLAAVESLRPFYEYARARSSNMPPRPGEHVVRRMVSSVEQLVR
jgi:hypothetical protein